MKKKVYCEFSSKNSNADYIIHELEKCDNLEVLSRDILVDETRTQEADLYCTDSALRYFIYELCGKKVNYFKNIEEFDIRPCSFAEKGDYLWTAVNNGGVVGFARINKSDFLMDVTLSPFKDNSTKQLGIFVTEDEVVLVPYWSNYIHVFSAENSEWNRIEIVDGNNGGIKFLSAIKSNGRIYLLPYQYNSVVEISLPDNNVRYIECSLSDNSVKSKEEFCYYINEFVFNGRVVFYSPKYKSILSFDCSLGVFNTEYEFENDVDIYTGCGCGDSYYSFVRIDDSYAVMAINLEYGTSRLCNCQIDLKYGDFPFTRSFLCDGRIFFIPGTANSIIYYDVFEKKIIRIRNTELEDYNNTSEAIFKYDASIGDEKGLYMYIKQDNRLIKYDICDSSVSSMILGVEKKELYRAYVDNIAGMFCDETSSQLDYHEVMFE